MKNLLKIPTLILVALFCFNFADAGEKRTLADVYSDGVKLYEAGRYSEALKYFTYVNSKNPRDPRNMRYLKMTQLAISEGRKAKRDLEGELKSVTIPEVNFVQASLGEVMAYLSKRVQEISNAQRSANFIYKGTNEQRENTLITLQLRNAPVTDVIKYVGSLSDTKFDYDEHAIVGTPLSESPKTPQSTEPTQNANGFETKGVNPLPTQVAPNPFK